MTLLAAGEGALHVFRRLAKQAPDQPFLAVDGEDVSRSEFLRRVSIWAGALSRRGVGEGNHVAIIMHNCIDWCVAFWAAVSLGAHPVPLDPQVGAWELERLLSVIDVKLCLTVSRYRAADLGASLINACARLKHAPALVCLDCDLPGMISREEFLREADELAVPARAVTERETLMLACTSGTTGNPKIIVVPHIGFVRAQVDMATVLALCPDDRMLLGMPLFHQGGFGMGLQTLLAGGTAIYQSAFDPSRFLATMESRRISAVQLSATLAKIVLSHPHIDAFDLSSLRLAYFAGEVLPDAIAAEFWQKRRVRVVNVIGSSETATMVMWDSDRDAGRSPTEFLSLPFTGIRVGTLDAVDPDLDKPGALWVSTDALLLGYHANPKETEGRLVVRDGRCWFDTQDLVLALPDGYVRFVGRLKRVIKRGPNLVHPEEVEAFLLTRPGIAAVAIVREQHELYGESMVAWVEPAPGACLTRGDLLALCRGKIAAYKIPDRFVVVDHIPVDIGKVQYKRIAGEETSL